MGIAIAVLVSACLLAAVLYGVRLFALSLGRKRADAAIGAGTAGRGSVRACPLCSSSLSPDQRVKSSLFPGKADRIMHIYGCVHCWPAKASARETQAARRTCPACGGYLEPEGYVIARYFERPGRRHVHVLGCTGCRR